MASFTYSPPAPLSAQVVTFASTSTGTVTSLAWDLDGDAGCDDATGPVATRTFATAGVYSVALCVNGDAALQRQTVLVRNRPPRADFSFSGGGTVTVTSTSVDLDGPIVAYAWDLDGDGAFDDGNGIGATVALAPGLHRIGLRVVDRDGAAASVYRPVLIAADLLRPFPLVRLRVVTTPAGARVKLLGVRAAPGVRVTVRCRGRGCPWKRRSLISSDGGVRFRRLQRRLRAGTVIEVFAARPGTVGKYTRFRIRRGHAPARVDACFVAGSGRASACPGG
ncbi:MAG: PKD domain-containing protein [Thermoleophilaceae bacterium]|nr:PKD domain-containing protein [Thermoleophilaceae bacterium]